MRELFEIPREIAYFNAAYLAIPLKKGLLSLRAAESRIKRPWDLDPSQFFEDVEAVRERFSTLIGADSPDAIALVASASYGLAVAANNVAMASGQTIVLLEEQFPSNVYVWMEKAKELGLDLRFASRKPSWTESVLNQIDSQTAVVAVPQCHWSDGSALDLVAVGKRAREVGAALVLDLTQSLGAVPFPLEEVRPDFVVASAYKWLLGPYGMAYLYASPDRRDGRPIEFNWINRRNAENFAGLVQYKDEYASGARRYDMGQKSRFLELPVARAALDQILDWGVGKIHDSLKSYINGIESHALEMGFEPQPASSRLGHMLGMKVPKGMDPQKLAGLLREQKVYVSVRGESVRISPHLYNDEQDMNELNRALKKALSQ